MAGVFLQTTKVFNRAPETVHVFFDGERRDIPPGYFDLPNVTLYHAKNQNPVMGSGDPNNPHESGTRYLVVEPSDEGYGEPLTKEEWADHLGKPCRVDEQAAFAEKYANDPKAKLIARGTKNPATARNRYEAGSAPRGNADFSNK